MEGIKIDNVLMNLSKSKKREIFYSEGDFQFSLGCEIKCIYPDMNIIAEKPMEGKLQTSNGKKATEHIDMFLYNKEIKIGIELKYIKDKFSGEVGDNYYKLSPSLAYDLRCYDILKDIQRLEKYVESENIDEHINIGYAIVLTNAKNLWTPQANGKESNYDEFRVFDRRKIHGEMKWKPATGDGTKKGRTDPINLKGNYTIQWKDYSEPKPEGETGNVTKNLFKYSVVEIK